jgi:predicted Mrr-cat superfamily restriction endonuclease
MEKEKKIWLHRISHHAEVAYPLLDNGYLSIGFSAFSSHDFIKDVRGGNGEQLFEEYFDWIWESRPRTRNNLWRFVAEMREGHLVVVPSLWGTFSVFELTEDMARLVSEIELSEIMDWDGKKIEKKEDGLYTTTGQLIDLGFVRKVKLIAKDIPRYEYADSALTSRMKNQYTNFDITDLKASIEKALECFKKGQPLNIYSPNHF